MKMNHFKLEGSWEEFEHKFLKVNKLREFSSGSFASVYEAHETSRHVYKICDDLEGRVDGYMAYLTKVVLRQQDNPFVPRIYGINTYESGGKYGKNEYHAIIRMERLHPYLIVGGDERMDILRNRYGIKTEPKRGYYGEDSWLDSTHDSLNKDMSLVMEIFESATSPELLKVLRSINRYLHKFEDMDADMHEGNVMWRKRGKKYELVITDPMA